MRRYLTTLFLAIPLAGWAADPAPERGPLVLTLKRAVELAISPEGNTYIQLSDESVKQAKSRTEEARSAFLPDIEAQAGEQTSMRSLAALGLDLATNQALTQAENSLTGAFAPIEKDLLNEIIKDIPRAVGPFTSVDVRVSPTESVLNSANIRRYKSSKAALRATKAAG